MGTRNKFISNSFVTNHSLYTYFKFWKFIYIYYNLREWGISAPLPIAWEVSLAIFPVCSLTVEEHLQFYGSLKGIKKKNIDTDTDKMIEDVGLVHKKTALAKSLSGL